MSWRTALRRASLRPLLPSDTEGMDDLETLPARALAAIDAPGFRPGHRSEALAIDWAYVPPSPYRTYRSRATFDIPLERARALLFAYHDELAVWGNEAFRSTECLAEYDTPHLAQRLLRNRFEMPGGLKVEYLEHMLLFAPDEDSVAMAIVSADLGGRRRDQPTLTPGYRAAYTLAPTVTRFTRTDAGVKKDYLVTVQLGGALFAPLVVNHLLHRTMLAAYVEEMTKLRHHLER